MLHKMLVSGAVLCGLHAARAVNFSSTPYFPAHTRKRPPPYFGCSVVGQFSVHVTAHHAICGIA